MATDNTRKPTRRKPTRRGSRPKETVVDSHYSKLTRKSSQGSTRRPAATNHPKQDPGSTAAYATLSQEAQERIYGKRGVRRQQSGNVSSALIGIAIIVAFALGGVFFWNTRSVSVTLNGQAARIRVGSTLKRAYAKADVETTPGNYVSVGGTIITEGEGYPFSAKVNGKDLTQEELDDYRIRGKESIEFGNGGDKMEPYDVDYREVHPKLVFQGDYGAVSFVKQWGKVGRQEVRTGKESGETADGDWAEEVQDCLVVTKNITPEGNEKLVALTFDDGPSDEYTAQILDILAQNNAKATFFNLSGNEQDNPQMVQRLIVSDNQICSHTYQHLQLSELEADAMVSDIKTAHDMIYNASGVDTTIIRPPYGDFTRDCWMKTGGCISVSVTWNQDTADWELPGSDAIVENALYGVQPGSIILMHDGGGDRSQTVEALPQVIERLRAEGYTLVTISELLESDPEVPTSIAKGNASLPKGSVWPTEMGAATIDVG